MTSRQQSNLAAALRYTEVGIPIFPAQITQEDEKNTRWSKKPHITDWQAKATTDQATIREWWSKFPDAVPAIPLANINLVAIDVDRREGADGVESFAELLDGQIVPVGPVTKTAGGGMHYIFRQPEAGEPLGNGRGDLPEGIDVRGHGGFIIAAGTVRCDGVAYLTDGNGPDLAEAYAEGTIPVLPEFLEKIIRSRRPRATAAKAVNADQPPAPTRREQAYACCALDGCARELENAAEGQRNNTLNAVVYRMARMSAARWVDPKSVNERLVRAAKKCGLLAKEEAKRTEATFKSAWHGGLQHPHPPLGPKASPIADASTDSIIVRWAGSKDWPAPKWLVQDLIPENSLGLIVGESQAGKSFVSMSLAGALAVGKPFFGKDIREPGGMVYVGAEASLTIAERLEAEFEGSIKPHLQGLPGHNGNIDLSTMPICVLGNIPDLADPASVESLIGKLLFLAEEMQARYHVPLQLVVVDTMVAAIGLEDWNSAAQAQSAVNVLKSIQRETGAAAIGVHHHGKDKSRGAAGSFVFGAAPDFILTVHRIADQNGVAKRRWVALTKSRSRETGWSCDFDLRGVMVGIDDLGGELYCPFVEPQLSQAPTVIGGFAGSQSQGKSVARLRLALDETLASNGKTIDFDDGRFTATRKDLVRSRFDDLYGGKTDEANRKAFNRAFKALSKESEVLIKQKDGDDWLCPARPVDDLAQPDGVGRRPVVGPSPQKVLAAHRGIKKSELETDRTRTRTPP